MLFRRCGLCSRRNRKINVVWGARGENVSKTLENRILLQSVSTLLSLIVVHNLQGLTRRFCFFSFPFYFFTILELPRIVIQSVYHGDGHYRGLSVRQTSSLLETGRSDVCGGKVVPLNIFIDSMA